jgi:dsDNA-specific endonuclease/ATPase MutS2
LSETVDLTGVPVPSILERVIRLEQAVTHLQHQQAEHAALSAVSHVETELRTAGRALLTAAQTLKAAGATSQASDTHRAAQRALKAAEDLRG